MKPISPAAARELVNFAADEQSHQTGFASGQLEGSVAAFNMLARNRCAYLADEVGLGKTYVALGVMAYLRYMKPNARIMVIAPRENIQQKWVKELGNFVRRNWLAPDHRVKSLQREPVHPPALCSTLNDMARRLALGEQQDLFLRMPSFSLATKERKTLVRYRKELLESLPWLTRKSIPVRNRVEFLDGYGAALNAAIPTIDLLVIDEAHNLKAGYVPNGATRNRLLAAVFGRGLEYMEPTEHYRPRVRAALLLSATPFEEEYGAVWRQFDVLGLGDLQILDPQGKDPRPLRLLADSAASLAEKRALLRRVMLRRVASYNINQEPHTKNMYRREWRYGGFDVHDESMSIEDTREKLSVALVQKKVSEVLQDDRFNNHFQIGMLSSFESFMETARHKKRRAAKTEEEDEDPVFSGDTETATRQERRGVDGDALRAVVESYQSTFGRTLPHPKLDATARALAESFETGEKALVFVRRVATVRELAAKLEREFDAWIEKRLREGLPQLSPELDSIFQLYRSETAGTQRGDVDDSVEDEVGGTETFFAWYYRGDGPDGYLSGAAFQKNRLSNEGSVLSTLFEDDYVAWLLGRPEQVLESLAARLNRAPSELGADLRARGYGEFRARTTRESGYPRIRVHEAYQTAALGMLADLPGEIGSQARVILQERFPEFGADAVEPPPGFPQPSVSLGMRSLLTELVRRAELRELIWPDDAREQAFTLRFRRREQRRELLSSLCRLGIAFIDLYSVAMRDSETLQLRRSESEGSADLIDGFLELLEEQRQSDRVGALRELHEAAESFDLILSVNFPNVHDAELADLSRIYGRTLQNQVPVGAMSGKVNHRLVRQFRMPGFPIVLISTDLLQEGEDLHTFCQRVIHYGITWTPSAMEQRTGRVDRINSLAQRRLDGRPDRPHDDEWIQVYYPHLQDTVEYVQVRRVMHRLSRFLKLSHTEQNGRELDHGRLDLAGELLSTDAMPEPIQGRLDSAFPVDEEWLVGASELQDGPVIDLDALEAHLNRVWARAMEELGIQARPALTRWARNGVVTIRNGKIRAEVAMAGRSGSRRQQFRLQLRSQRDGQATLLRCESAVGQLTLDDETVDLLYELQRALGGARICTGEPDRFGRTQVSVANAVLFDPKTTQIEEVIDLVSRTTLRADRLEERVLAVDVDPEAAEDTDV